MKQLCQDEGSIVSVTSVIGLSNCIILLRSLEALIIYILFTDTQTHTQTNWPKDNFFDKHSNTKHLHYKQCHQHHHHHHHPLEHTGNKSSAKNTHTTYIHTCTHIYCIHIQPSLVTRKSQLTLLPFITSQWQPRAH